MSITVSCPGCGTSYSLDDSLRGRKVRCKECRETIEVGGLDALPADLPPLAEAVYKGSRRPAAGRRRARRDDEEEDLDRGGGGIPPWVWVLVGVGLLVVLAIGVRVYFVWVAARAIGNAVDNTMANLKKMPANPNAPPGWPFGAADPADLDGALADLRGNDANRRIAAGRWLAREPVDNARRAELAKALEPLLDDRNSGVRVAGMRAMEVWAGPENVPAILRLLDSNPTGFEGDECRKRAIDTLAKLKDARGAPAVARNFKQPFEREWTRRSLIALGPAAEDAVLPYLEDDDWGVRVEACHTLKQIGTRKSLPALQAVLEGTKKMYGGSRDVAAAAKEAIDAIQARP
jgi:predicted Zn finger-like uncharacterized protein